MSFYNVAGIGLFLVVDVDTPAHAATAWVAKHRPKDLLLRFTRSSFFGDGWTAHTTGGVILTVREIERIRAHRRPTKGEIRFGEGATHYAEFDDIELWLKSDGTLKKWIVSPIDGLRYYR